MLNYKHLVNALPAFQIILFLHHHLKNSYILRVSLVGLPGDSDGREFTCSVGDLGSIPELDRPLEEGMATHSSILAWRIPWTEELGGQQSVGLQNIDTTERLSTAQESKWKPLRSSLPKPLSMLHTYCLLGRSGRWCRKRGIAELGQLLLLPFAFPNVNTDTGH